MLASKIRNADRKYDDWGTFVPESQVKAELAWCVLGPVEEVFFVFEDHASLFECAFAVDVDAVVVAAVRVVALHPVVVNADGDCAYLFEAWGKEVAHGYSPERDLIWIAIAKG